MEAKSFWEDIHKRKFLPSLTGSQYNNIVYDLKLQDYIKPNIHLLEVGVGLGYATKGLHDNGVFVSGLDISELALENVKQYCEVIYTIDDLDKLPSDYFDVIVCSCVVQHVPTELLIEELKHCIRSLKSDGVFAIQFVSNNKIEDLGIAPHYHVGRTHAGTCCRQPKYFEKIINDLGGTCEMVVDEKCFYEEIHGSHIFHVRKA